jgi:DNA-binding transcriptional LysR family regulator
VRIGRLPESTLVALPIAQTRRVVCAAPAYLKRAGTPATPQALSEHRTIDFIGLSSNSEWTFGGKGPKRVAIKPFLHTNQIDVALDACLRGLGCAQFLCYQVDELVRAGRLRHVLAEFEPPFMPIQIVYPHARLLSSNVRAFVDVAVAQLRRPQANGAPAARTR